MDLGVLMIPVLDWEKDEEGHETKWTRGSLNYVLFYGLSLTGDGLSCIPKYNIT